MTYYTTTEIDKKKATYNVIFGERSNGKTYALLEKGLRRFFKDGTHTAYIRRWKEDIIGRRAQQLFAGIVENGLIEKLSNGKYQGVIHYAGKFYLCTFNEQGKAIYNDSDLFAFAFALSDTEHDKSVSYPKITTIIFDEFLTNKLYLQNEFVLFMNAISTIVRKRDNATIYMLGNTVNKYCPYFAEMGLTNVLKMEQGKIDVYRYGESKLTVAVEYCATSKNSTKKSNKYFAFNNPKLQMITGGVWELDIYPHNPYKYKPKDIRFIFFIDFTDQLFQGEIIQVQNEGQNLLFCYIHVKTTEIKDANTALIYSLTPDPRLNYNSNIWKPTNKVQQRVLWFFENNRVFYQNNNVGDAVNNFLKLSKR